MRKRKNEAAVALGRRRAKLAGPEGMAELSRMGASLGGQARARSLSPAKRRQIARKAATAKWAMKKGSKRE